MMRLGQPAMIDDGDKDVMLHVKSLSSGHHISQGMIKKLIMIIYRNEFRNQQNMQNHSCLHY